MTKKTAKNVTFVEFIEKVAELYFCGEPTDEDIVKIVSALGDKDYQSELVKSERRRYKNYGRDEDDKPEVETIYILNIYKTNFVTKEVEK